MRWYNPKRGTFEWRDAPETDEEALSLISSCPDTERYAKVYREWRDLGASAMVALIRTGEAARENGREE